MNAEIRIQSTRPIATFRATSRAAHRFAAFAAVGLLSIAGVACLGASSETHAPSVSDARTLEEQIEELRQAIERDHEALTDLITRPDTEAGPKLHDDPELRAIAARLTEQQRRLERLEAAAKAAR